MSEKPKYDPNAQYGDYCNIDGYDAPPEAVAEVKTMLREQIAATAKELGTVWPDDMIRWGVDNNEEYDPETGKVYPVTSVWWKTIPQKKEEGK